MARTAGTKNKTGKKATGYKNRTEWNISESEQYQIAESDEEYVFLSEKATAAKKTELDKEKPNKEMKRTKIWKNNWIT